MNRGFILELSWGRGSIEVVSKIRLQQTETMAPPETRPEPPEFILMCADMLKLYVRHSLRSTFGSLRNVCVPSFWQTANDDGDRVPLFSRL